MPPSSERARWALVVVLGTVLLMALNVWWVATFRHGFPMDIDEAGYTTFGLVDYIGLKTDGIDGWWDAIQAQPKFPPLIPALTSFVVYVKPGFMAGFVVLTAFLMVLSLAIYGIGERIAGPRLGALAALITATLPGTFAFSREYIFALPVAAFLACALFALLRSDGLVKRRWAIACGAALGLMLLSRSMAIVYVPGVLAAGVLAMLTRQHGDLRLRLTNLALVLVAGVAVAATWYARNLQSVIDYLTDYGYGSKSKFYGDDEQLISWGRFRSVSEHMTTEDLLIPLAALFLAAIIAMAFVAIRKVANSPTPKAALKSVAESDAISIVVVFAAGYAALMTSQNGGNGFTYPLAILLPLLVILAIQRFQLGLLPAVATFGVIAMFNLVSTATIWDDASRTRLVSIPGIDEDLPLTKGVPKAVFAFRQQVPGPEATFDEQDKAWLRADEALLEELNELNGPYGEAPVVAFASRNRAISSNTVQLASVANDHRGIPFVQLEAEPSDSVSTYLDQLEDSESGESSVLVTMSRNTNDFPPVVTQSYAERAAKLLDFKRIHTMALPDGRQLRLWQREAG